MFPPKRGAGFPCEGVANSMERASILISNRIAAGGPTAATRRDAFPLTPFEVIQNAESRTREGDFCPHA
jgi:hypothetical protein